MIGLVVAALFILLNGFFVAAEFALVKVSTTQLSSRAKKGDPRAMRAHEVVSRLERYLSVTQFGITLASLGLGWIGQPAVESLVSRAAFFLFGRGPGDFLRLASVVIAFTGLTFMHVLFGELVPKLVAIQRSERLAVAVAAPLHVLYTVFRPLLWTLERATKVILPMMGMSSDAASEGKLSEAEILGILVANTARTPSGRAKAELVERVMRFAQRTARHAMVPRVDVASLPLDTTGKEACDALRTQQYSRVLLTKGLSLDEVAGYLYAKDFLLDPEAEKLPNLWTVRREVLFVPETQGLLEVLREMQHAHTPIAVVVDEYGGSSGIVTMEDLLEEIVGEIRDEFDVEPARVLKVPDTEGAWDVDARATLEELRALGVLVHEDEWAETLGTVVLARLGRLPRKGDKVNLGGDATAEVTSLSRRRVTGVRVRLAKAPPQQA